MSDSKQNQNVRRHQGTDSSVSMNLVIENIKKRKSVRLYEKKPVPKDIINMIIEAGNLAPSTGEEKMVEEGGKKRNIIECEIHEPSQVLQLKKVEKLRRSIEETQKYELLTTNQYLQHMEPVIEILDDISHKTAKASMP